MTLKIAVVGNTGMNIGAAVAGDMALGGHDVRFLLWPEQAECLEACRAVGALHRGFVDIVDALLGTNSWESGLTLKRLGLDNLDVAGINAYAETGEKA